MEKETDYLIVTDENGKEIKCEIIMTFESEEFKKSYVVYQIIGDKSKEYYAASFNPADGDEGKLSAVETDEEWNQIEEVLESFLEEQDESDEEDEEDEDDEDDEQESETDDDGDDE
ncbi:MAG: DUF1292 domain-containing protein [Candidatus Izemoplasmatales bacterium]|jgi:uncharacterized protein YrzB (UPF0473 family)|nr:DUF1292 domain-containing protein [Candidatus Izemoplasmatales bacterium]MDD4595277.1 DUF1292 domain-containing protein [Candidatus Izemoplasmatales bacterium]